MLQHAVGTVFSPNAVPPDYIDKTGIELTLRPYVFQANAQDVRLLSDFLDRQQHRYPEIGQPLLLITGENDDMVPAYERVRDRGRMLPDGLTYVGSWIEAGFGRCFQLMECDDAALLQEWVLKWRGTGTSFEIVPVVPSKETQAVLAAYLDGNAAN